MAGSPADTGGLMPGDLITAVQSKAVHSVDDFAALLGRMSVGTNVTFDVLRDNERHSVEVVLGRKQLVSAVPQFALRAPCHLSRPKASAPCRKRAARQPLGIRVEIVSNEIHRARNIPADSGVRVTKVTPNSAADKAGIPIDAIILEINGRAIGSPDEAAQALSRAARRGADFLRPRRSRSTVRAHGHARVRGNGPHGNPGERTTTSGAQPREPAPAPPDPMPPARRETGAKKPVAVLNDTIDDTRTMIRRLEQRVAELEKQLELLQRTADKEREDINEVEEAIRNAPKKGAVPVKP